MKVGTHGGRWERKFERLGLGPVNLRQGSSVLVLLAAVAVMLLGFTLPARAHAQLEDTSPADGTVADDPPARIELRFSEPVSPVAFEMRSGGVEIPVVTRSDGSTVVVEPEGLLPDGTAVLDWQVVSTDGHPIGGNLVFHVRVATEVEESDSGTPVNGGLIVGNALMYVGLVLGGGLSLFRVLVLEGEGEKERLRRLTFALLGIGVIGTAVTLALRATGGPLGFATLPTGAAPAMVAAALGSTLAMAGQPKRVPVTVGVAIALLAPVLTGHTRSFEPGWLMMASDAVHLYAAAVWAGGLVGIALLTKRHRSEHGVLVSRFGRLAAWSLATVMLSGLTLAWTLHRSWDSLTGSEHGRLVLLKLAIVLAVAGVGAFNRYRLVPALAAAGAKARRMLAGTTAIEAAGLVLVLVVTSALVDKDPAGAAELTEAQGPVQTAIGDLVLTVGIEPGDRGANETTIDIRSLDGGAADVTGPVTVVVVADGDRTSYDAAPDSDGHRATIDIPRSGEWGVEVHARVDQSTEAVASLVLDTSTGRFAPASGLLVAGAVMPAPPGGAGSAAVYMSVLSAQDDELVGASSSVCQEATLHETVIAADGTASMEHRHAIELRAAEPLRLEAGGLHVMCQASGIEAGDIVPFRIITRSGEHLDFLVPVVNITEIVD